MTPPRQNDAPHPFTPYLQPGEKLLWVGRPDPAASRPKNVWRTHWYALTSQRLLRFIGTAEIEFDSLTLDKIVGITIEDDGNGCGTIRCHAQHFTSFSNYHLMALKGALSLYQQIQAAAGRDIFL